jgi:hypothetical protein
MAAVHAVTTGNPLVGPPTQRPIQARHPAQAQPLFAGSAATIGNQDVGVETSLLAGTWGKAEEANEGRGLVTGRQWLLVGRGEDPDEVLAH